MAWMNELTRSRREEWEKVSEDKKGKKEETDKAVKKSIKGSEILECREFARKREERESGDYQVITH